MDEQDRLRSTPYYKARVEQRKILRSLDSIGGFIQHLDSQTSGLLSAVCDPIGAAVKELEEREAAEKLADQDFEQACAGPQSSLQSADTTSAPEITEAPQLQVNPPRPEKATPTERHAALVDKLERHIEKGRADQSNYFSSKAAFCRALKVDQADYYRWQRGDELRAPGHAKLIESKIETLPE